MSTSKNSRSNSSAGVPSEPSNRSDIGNSKPESNDQPAAQASPENSRSNSLAGMPSEPSSRSDVGNSKPESNDQPAAQASPENSRSNSSAGMPSEPSNRSDVGKSKPESNDQPAPQASPEHEQQPGISELDSPVPNAEARAIAMSESSDMYDEDEDPGMDSIEDEIQRHIAAAEAIGCPLTQEQKDNIAQQVRARREGHWIEALKFENIDKDSVPAGAFSRVVDELDRTAALMTAISAEAEQKLAEKESELNGLRSERTERAELKRLRSEITELKGEIRERNTDVFILQTKNDDLEGKIDASEQRESTLRDHVQSLQKRIAELQGENKGLKNGAGLQKLTTTTTDRGNNTTDLSGDAELQAGLKERDDTIKTLKAELKEAREKASSSKPILAEKGSMEELQARCAELREARDNYREKWARGVMAGSGGLLEFWDAVENTSREIKQLYQGIDKLSRLLGVADGVMDTPQILERILAQVSDSVEDVKYPSPAIQILGLRVANMAAQTQIATLRVKLEQAQQPKTDAEMQAFLGVVDEEEVERRVSNRTQTYRQHRCELLRHIFDAQVEFLALARRSGGNRAAIEKLVGQYLEPSSLPMIQPVQVDLV